MQEDRTPEENNQPTDWVSEEEIKDIKSQNRTRTVSVGSTNFMILSALGGVIIIYILIIQLGSKGAVLREKGDKNVYDTTRLVASRGDILSDNGGVLSTSIPYYDLRIDFGAPGIDDSTFRADVKSLASSMSKFFKDKSTESYEELLRKGYNSKHRYFSIAPRKVNYIELQSIKTFAWLSQPVLRSGFRAIEDYRRVRPFGDLASRTVGFVNTVGVKVGIEGAYDDALCGIDGISIQQKISGDFWMPIPSELNINPRNGYNIHTTLNIEMQEMAQDALFQSVKENEADWGTVIVMEVETGEIKAIANVCRNPNGKLVEDYNYAVGMSLEPGSTFKLPVLVDLLENSSYTLGTMIDTEDGRVKIGKATVVDTKRGGYGRQTLEGVFEHSSNIGMAKAANKVFTGRESDFVERIENTGLGHELGLSLPGEPRPVFKHPSRRSSGWDGTSLTMMSFGYAVRLTPLQTLTYYNAVANGGKFIRPRFVTSLSYKGETIQEFPMEVINPQIASPETIRLAQRALRSVVENGTAKALQNPLYSVAAKTGTAQIAQGRSGYKSADGSRYYLASLAGYFPAENPRYSMMIAFKVHHTQNSKRSYYGGSLAAPLFKTIADGIYNSSSDFLRPVNYRDQEAAKHKSSPSRKFAKVSRGEINGMPNVEGMVYDNALETLESKGFTVEGQGVGYVESQRLKGDSTVILRFRF